MLGFASRFPLFEQVLPRPRDPRFEAHAHDRGDTWEKLWWRMSGNLGGLVIERVCQAWSCRPGDLLAPVADRGWDDRVDPGIPGVAEVSVLRLERP